MEKIEHIQNDYILYEKIWNSNIIERKHCILRSGKHSDVYIKKTKITLNKDLYKEVIYKLFNMIVNEYNRKRYDAITGPAVAGICFAAPLSFLLEKPLIFPEKKEKILDVCMSPDFNTQTTKTVMEFRKEYKEFLTTKNPQVILIEDIITIGGSIIKTAESVSDYGGKPIAVFCIWNRNPDIQYVTYNHLGVNHKIPIYSLINKSIKSWDREKCPICNNIGI